MKIEQDKIIEIKSRIDIRDLISEYMTLKKAGTSLFGLCPFHNEKTPSFSVNQTKQFFNCFGCGELIDKRKRDFIQVVKRCEIAFADCPNICFHSQCWLDAAGEEFEIK